MVARTKSNDVPFARRSLHEQLVRHLGMRIVRDELKAGDRLPSEPELCVELNVGRTALREALRVLVAKGLVESRPKTGTRVRPRSEWNLLDPDVLAWQHGAELSDDFVRNLCEIRLIVEPAAARRAAARATDDEVMAIEAWCRRMELVLESVEPYIHADLQFHAALLAATHNELLQQMSGTIALALRASRVITTQLPGASAAAMPLHRTVVEAIRRRDEAGAEAAMRALAWQAAADIDRVLQATRHVPPAAGVPLTAPDGPLAG